MRVRLKQVPNVRKVDMNVMKVHRMKFTWDSPIFKKKKKKSVSNSHYFIISHFLHCKAIMVLAKEETQWNTLLPLFSVVSQSPANGTLERGLLDDKDFIDLF